MRMQIITNQLALSFPDPGTQPLTERLLSHALRKPVELIFTENSSTMISARQREGILTIRVHQMFEWAGADVFEDLVRFLQGKPGPHRVLDQFIRSHRQVVRPPEKMRSRDLGLDPAGTYHDLRPMLEEMLRVFFPELPPPRIGWGRWRRRGRSLRLGSYDLETHAIRIHPRLDRKFVPAYVIAVIIHHELCHAHLARHHGSEAGMQHDERFKSLECLHPAFEEASRWERENLHRL